MRIVLAVFCLCVLGACSTDYTPRPRAYPRVLLPEKSYERVSPNDCPFSFEIPTYSHIVYEKNEEDSADCWMSLQMDVFKTKIFLTYKNLQQLKDQGLLREEMHRMTYVHAQKADCIEPTQFETEYKNSALIYNVCGNAASPTQFYITDTTSHFIRGSLYFNTNPNADSLQPLIDFYNKDIEYLIRSLKWEE